jgi:molecular chaperone HtpG
MTFDSMAERHAESAQHLPAFHDLNLTGIKDKVAQILQLIGRDSLFREYTLHDISHVDEMLCILDWLIPTKTQQVMTPADWLLIVLSVYFHDVGMLVTKAEFEARSQSGFPTFCEDELFAGDEGIEYRSKVLALGAEADQFLYEEFVRRYHADRIADWINGRANVHQGVSTATATEVTSVLSALPREFRADLSLVCQSHHLADLANLAKYKISQPYGNSDAETANVHYAALLLRSADLLHINANRTPSVMFRLIDPQDPVSQREWAKQSSVRRVRPKKAVGGDVRSSDEPSQDTIEVFATFQEANGFFGLTSFLRYAEDQLIQTSDWARMAAEQQDAPYVLPWRRIDDTEVTATGFLPEKLGFSLDQDRILDLLTGHTLYGDSDVVIREVVQNALDATRLQMMLDGQPSEKGIVKIHWASTSRTLTIRDNGTGMSQSVIERNLLRAGASLYQEDTFKRQHPDFSPISRFGIGVLSTFMIADRVEITTCSPDDEEARHLTLRSVHGRYLVQLLDKSTDERARSLAPHGTEVTLRLRASVELTKVLDIVKRWVVVPKCSVTAQVDDTQPVPIGFASPGAALEAVIEQLGQEVVKDSKPANGAIKVLEEERDGVVLAFAVMWSEYFREWEFLGAPTTDNLLLGTCVEGIRVEDSAPGFSDAPILAICNASGPGAPKTNVARSGLEHTPERVGLLRSIYCTYFSHVTTECAALSSHRGESITRAAQEAHILLSPLFRESDFDREFRRRNRAESSIVDIGLFEAESRRHRFLLVEAEGIRDMRAADILLDEAVVWTVDSEFVRAAEHLLREIPSHATLRSLAEAFATESFSPPAGTMLIGYDPDWFPHRVGLRDRVVGQIIIRPEQKRADLGWIHGTETDRWVSFATESGKRDLMVAATMPEGDGLESVVGVRAHGTLYLLADVPAGEYLLQLMGRSSGDAYGQRAQAIASSCVLSFLTAYKRPVDVDDFVERSLASDIRGVRSQALQGLIDRDALADALRATRSNIFDTWAWSRRTDTTEI